MVMHALIDLVVYDIKIVYYVFGNDFNTIWPPASPHLDRGVLKALGHKVDGLVCLVLVRLDRRLLRLERTALGLVRQGIL